MLKDVPVKVTVLASVRVTSVIEAELAISWLNWHVSGARVLTQTPSLPSTSILSSSVEKTSTCLVMQVKVPYPVISVESQISAPVEEPAAYCIRAML